MDTLKAKTQTIIRPLLRQHSTHTDEENSETEMVQISKSPKLDRSSRLANASPKQYLKNQQTSNLRAAKSLDDKRVLRLHSWSKSSSTLRRDSSLSRDGSQSSDELNRSGSFNKENVDAPKQRKRSNTICSLNGVIYCPICSDTLSDPKMLPCQHTFCLTCLRKYCQPNESILSCPTCRAETKIPIDGLQSLPSNIAIQSVLDALLSEADKGTKSQHCDKCQSKCNVNQARLCEHCKQMLCMVCWPVHMNHLFKQLQKLNSQFETQEEQLLLHAEEFKSRCEKMSENISQTIQEKIQHLLTEENNLQKQLKELVKKDERDRENLRLKLLTCKEQLDESVKQTPTSRTWISTYMAVHNNCSDVISQVQNSLPPQIRFDCEHCRIQETSPSQQNNIRQPSFPESEVTFHSETPTTRAVVQRNSHLKPYLQRPACVLFSPWVENEVFVVSTDTHQVHILDINGSHLRNFGRRGHSKGEFLCPCGIAASTMTDEIYVTDKWRHCVLVFTKEGKFLREFGGKGRSPGHLRSPEGIDVTLNGDLYICDTCNDRVHLLNKQGEFIRELGKITSSKHADGKVYRKSEFNEPCDIKVAPDGKVVVCDSGHKRMKVYASDGSHLLTFGNHGSQKGQFNSPTCLAIDKEGYIYVGDSGNGRVQVFSPSGSFIRSFGHFSWIRGIAISRNHDIVTTDFKSHKLKIFSLE